MRKIEYSFGCVNNGEYPKRQLFKNEEYRPFEDLNVDDLQNRKDVYAINECLKYHHINAEPAVHLFNKRYYKVTPKRNMGYPFIASPIIDTYCAKLRLYIPTNNLDLDIYRNIASECVSDIDIILKRSITIDLVPGGIPVFENTIKDLGVLLFNDYIHGNIQNMNNDELFISNRLQCPFIWIYDIYEGTVINDMRNISSKNRVICQRMESYSNNIDSMRLEMMKNLERLKEKNKNED